MATAAFVVILIVAIAVATSDRLYVVWKCSSPMVTYSVPRLWPCLVLCGCCTFASSTASAVTTEEPQSYDLLEAEATTSAPFTDKKDVEATLPQRPLSAERCHTVTRRPSDDIIIGDPNSLAQGHPQGIHLSLGETLCITGRLEKGGRLNEFALLHDEATPDPVVALRLLDGTQGTTLQIATTSDRVLHYDAYIQVGRSRLVVPTHALPARPNGVISYENWPSNASELWLTELRFISTVKPRYETFTPRTAPEHSLADRRWGMDFWLTTGLYQADFSELNRTLDAEGYGQFPNTYGAVGFEVGGFWHQLRFGIFVRGVPYDLAQNDTKHLIDGSAFTAGPYLGFDVIRYHNLITSLRLEYVPTEVGLSEADVLPDFARSDVEFYRITRSTHGIGFSLSQEFAIPIFTSDGGQVALGLRTELGYVLQVHEGDRWSYRDAQGQAVGPRITGGPRFDTSGWHVGLHVGVPIYVF